MVKSMKKFIPAIIFFLIIFSCNKRMEKITLSINGRPLIVEVARTVKQREKGLMFRKELGWNEGMLFVFQEENYLTFWMKNTTIPLSIAYVDKNGKVTDIFTMEPNSLKPVISSLPCMYAIEANRGFFRESGLRVGDRIDLGVIR